MAEAALAARPTAGAEAVLRVKGLQAWYNELHILHGVDLDVREGEVVTLLGRNGAGKTTTLKSIMGIVGKRSGSVMFQDRELVGLPIERIARLGVALCPEERAVFASLTVKENLFLPPVIAKTGGSASSGSTRSSPTCASGSRAAAAALGRRAADAGHRRILRTGARFLMLDEPTEGLAPVIIQQIGRTIAEIKREGFTILLVEPACDQYAGARDWEDDHRDVGVVLDTGLSMWGAVGEAITRQLLPARASVALGASGR